MRLKAYLVAVGMILLFVSPASAELTTGQWLVGGGGGLLLPTGDYHDLGKAGYNLGLRVDYMATPELAVGADLGYSRNDFSSDFVTLLELFSGGTAEGHYTIMQYTAHATALLSPGQKVRPYFTAGAGVYNFKASVTASALGTSVSGEDGETKGGVNGTVGMLIEAGTSAHVGIEASYHDIFTSGSSVTYANIRALVMFSVGGK